MKRFLGKILTFILAFILLLAILEYTYAALENDYSYKADHLSKSENTYETIILGSSHSYYGINPQLFDNSTFNLAHVSQSLDLDVYLLNKYKTKTNFKTVIIPISYFSFQQSLFESDESWRATDYYYSYALKEVPRKTKLFLLAHKRNIFPALFESALSGKSARRYVNEHGFAKGDHDPSNITLENALLAIERHSMSRQQLKSEHTLNPQFKNLSNCIERNPGLRFILVSLPVHKYYANARDSTQLYYVNNCIQSLVSSNQNVSYYNLHALPLSETDFKDADHLSKNGADKVSSYLNELITILNAEYIGDDRK